MVPGIILGEDGEKTIQGTYMEPETTLEGDIEGIVQGVSAGPETTSEEAGDKIVLEIFKAQETTLGGDIGEVVQGISTEPETTSEEAGDKIVLETGMEPVITSAEDGDRGKSFFADRRKRNEAGGVSGRFRESGKNVGGKVI